MRKFTSDIRSNQRGAVAIIVALSIAAILGMLLLTFDLGQQQSQKFNTQGAADASALVAAQIVSELRIKSGTNVNPPVASLRPRVLEAFRANSTVGADNDLAELDEDSVQVQYQSSAGNALTDRIRVDGCFVTNDSFNIDQQQNGNRQHRVCSFAVASLASFGNAEIVFALDVSASMNELAPNGQRRIQLLSDAVNQTVNGIVNSYGNGNDVLPETYWAVVPFRGMVDLGNEYSSFVLQEEPARNAALEADEKSAICAGGDCTANLTTQVTSKIAGVTGKYEFTDANLAKLRRIPLTAREGQDPKDFQASASNDEFDANAPFLSYGHQPWDYYMAWEKEACCGLCSTYRKEVPYYEDLYDKTGTCNPDPTCDTAPALVPDNDPKVTGGAG